MKTLFIEAKSDVQVELYDTAIKELPEKIALVTTIQFIDSLPKLKTQLEQAGKKVILVKGKRAKHEGQMLGCDIISGIKADVDAFLYIGDGLFHPKALLIKNEKPVFTFNPFNKSFKKLDQAEIEAILKKQKGALLKYHSSKEIGILVTTKPGQQQLKKALDLKNKVKDKNFYIFLCDTLDFNDLENFPFIECWVNTMCPRIGYDDTIRLRKPVVNIEEI